MRELSNHAVLSMSDSTMAVSSKYTQDLTVQIVFFTFSCKWFLCFYFWAVIWSYIVDLFAALHELASASAHTLLKLASSVRALLKPYGDTLNANRLSSSSAQEYSIIQSFAKHDTPQKNDLKSECHELLHMYFYRNLLKSASKHFYTYNKVFS